MSKSKIDNSKATNLKIVKRTFLGKFKLESFLMQEALILADKIK